MLHVPARVQFTHNHNVSPVFTNERAHTQAVALHAAMHSLGVPTDLMARNGALKALAELGRAEEALALLDATIEAGLTPDEVSFSTVIHACGRAGQWEKVRLIGRLVGWCDCVCLDVCLRSAH